MGTPERTETEMRMEMAGRVLWVALVALYPLLQVWVVAAWPVPYLFLHHTVSDLGYTTCITEERPGGALQTCSPRHAAYNAISMAISAAVMAGGLLQHRRWSGGALGRAVSALFVIVGLSGIGTALVPGDVDITWHTLIALPLFLGQIALLVLLAVRLRRRSPALALIAALVAGVSLAGTVALGFALAGFGYVGLTERLSAETFYLFLLAAGLMTATTRSPAAATAAAEATAAGEARR